MNTNSQTQRIIVNRAGPSIGVVNAGPVGPTGAPGPSEAAAVLTTNGDLLTRAAGVLARITRANLAIDPAFTSTFPVIINHGSTASTARIGTAPILWIGSVNPTNTTNNDFLYRTDQTALYVRVAGAWVEVGSSRYSKIVNGTYTPTLGNLAIGTGGSPTNTAAYTFDGFSAGGILTVEGKIKFGTTGVTLPGASSETISLPSGYALINSDGLAFTSNTILYNDVSGGVNAFGTLFPVSTTALQLLVIGVTGGSRLTSLALAAADPFAWAINDEIYYRFSARCTGP